MGYLLGMTGTESGEDPAREGSSPFPFTFNEFKGWYEREWKTVHQPALDTCARVINELLDDQLNDEDRKRIRLSGSRIKGTTRLWAKITRPKYREQINHLEDIPKVIDDIVGIRMTCHNNSDVTTFFEALAALPSDEGEDAAIWLNPSSERKYFNQPKESGYRAYHINICTKIHSPKGMVPVTAEIQARTLLQDGWGELTHEDTYKPGMTLPPIATRIARRMADLLAAVDDLAQDLRDELERVAEEAIEREDRQAEVGPEAVDANTVGHSDEQSALISETRRVIGELARPAPLAAVAQRVQASFANNLAGNWGGYGAFANLVEAAVPGAIRSRIPPGVVLSPEYSMPERAVTDPDPSDTNYDELPPVVRKLKTHDKAFPAVSEDVIDFIISCLEKTLSIENWSNLDIETSRIGIKDLNALTRWARDFSTEKQKHIGKRYYDYLLKVLLFNGQLAPGLTQEEIRRVLVDRIFARALDQGLVENAHQDRADLQDWFGVELED